MADQNIGKVVQVIGPVLDVEFEGGQLPEIYNALHLSGTTDAGSDIDALEFGYRVGAGLSRTRQI